MTCHPGEHGGGKIARHLLAAGLTLSMGYVFGLFMLGGCGGSQAGFAPPVDGQLPERVVEKLTDCSKRGPTALQPVKHTVSFDIFMSSDGQVELVALRDSTLHFDEVEACMERALYAVWERVMDASLRRREPASGASLPPETRALLTHPIVLGAGAAEVAIVVGVMVVSVMLYYHVVRNTKTHRPPPPRPLVEDPPKPEPPKPEPQSAGDPQTTGPTPPLPPEPPKPPKPKPRCEEVFRNIVNCSYIKQDKYPTLKAALEALIKKLPKDRQKRPFTTRGKQGSDERSGVDHTTYWSADDRTKITIGCYDTCCKNTDDGPVLEERKQCYEHNTAYFR